MSKGEIHETFNRAFAPLAEVYGRANRSISGYFGDFG